jgi:hypothetical protein
MILNEQMNRFPFPDLPHAEKTDRARIVDSRHECAWSPEGVRFNRKLILDRIPQAIGLYEQGADSAEARFQDWRGLELVCWQSLCDALEFREFVQFLLPAALRACATRNSFFAREAVAIMLEGADAGNMYLKVNRAVGLRDTFSSVDQRPMAPHSRDQMNRMANFDFGAMRLLVTRVWTIFSRASFAMRPTAESASTCCRPFKPHSHCTWAPINASRICALLVDP